MEQQHAFSMSLAGSLIATSVASLCIGCGKESEVHVSEPPSSQVSDWRTVNGTPAVAVPADQYDGDLQRAMRHARATAEQARLQWMRAPLEHRQRWSIKWAAPTASDGVEHVWIQPRHWSAFRIEGVLLNQPIENLACGKLSGDLVSFPAEELSDWLHLTTNDPHAAYEGGFTIAAIEKIHGRP